MCGLPYGLRTATAPAGTAALVRVTGDAGGDWWVERYRDAWRLADPVACTPITTVTVAQDDAWRVLMKRISAADSRKAFPSIHIDGDQEIGNAFLETVCVMA